ncbi:exodeoxyribonuclease V subunit gamma [Gemmatimonas sp.]|jgi:exodeoxyribonuclease V gamma subunit|uniref:exodeoxyribonuclease V subunit gamma n=1 Tax=Gemmatimonas sp. TaxID=1962908 RepID=UPI0037BE6ECC
MTQLRIITGDSPAALLSRMAQELTAPPLPPLLDECIIVQSLGMERWVRQQLALRHGCAASLALPFPAAFCRRLAAGLQRDPHFATGDGVTIDARFEEQALVWRLFALLHDDALLAQDVCEPLRAFLQGGTDAKRYGLARQIAARFDEYRLYRAELLVGWEEGRDPLTTNAHEAWQAALWRTLLANERPAHFARWFLQTVERLESVAQRPEGLPERVSVFGVSTLPPLFIRLLRAVSRFVPVTFHVLLPNADSWRPGAMRHPFFEAFGQSSRDFLGLLMQPDARGVLPAIEHIPTAAAGGADSVLAQLQQSLRLGTVAPLSVPGGDRSLSVQVCHSPMRELEVLRDQLLDAFAADPTLRPHDVLVMAPDVEQYAPLAEAIFGHARTRGDEQRPHIPYRVADRTMSRESAPARALSTMLGLVSSRLTASEVLELLTQPLVRQAVGIAPSDVDQITTWIEDAAIRWGYDGAARAALQDVPGFEENSWRRGLDRLLAGYATGRVEALSGGVLPVAGDLMGNAELLGQFVEWVEVLYTRLDVLRTERPLDEWTRVLQDTLDWLVRSDDVDERAVIDRLSRNLGRLAELTDTRASAQGTRSEAAYPVSFDVVRDWVADTLAEDEPASGFLTGGLTICAMKPMRAIPHRIIVMLGLDDRAYPRRIRRPAFDVLSSDPHVGDRDPRADDRQLVLDTLMSAGDRLMLSYVGRSQTNNTHIAPSIVVTELLDRLDAMHGGPTPLSQTLRVEHPLQPFSTAYFTDDSTRDHRLFSFDQQMAATVQASLRRHPVPAFLSSLPPVPSLQRDWHAGGEPMLELTIDDLVDMWLNPARVYCRRVLQLSVAADETLIDDVEPTDMDPLLRHRVQQRMLDRSLLGRGNAARERALDVATGELPVGALGAQWHDRLRREMTPMLTRVGTPAFLAPLSVEVHGADWVLRGQLGQQLPGEQWRARAGKLNTRDKTRAWIAHVVRCATAAPVATRIIARDQELLLPPVENAMPQLDLLVQGVRAVRQSPLPYFPEAACVFSAKAHKGEPGLDAAIAMYEKNDDFGRGDSADPYVQLLWRGTQPVEELADDFMALADGFWSGYHALTSSTERAV